MRGFLRTDQYFVDTLSDYSVIFHDNNVLVLNVFDSLLVKTNNAFTIRLYFSIALSLVIGYFRKERL